MQGIKDQKSSATASTAAGTESGTATAASTAPQSKIFNLQKYLNAIKADAKLTAIDLSQQKTYEAKAQLKLDKKLKGHSETVRRLKLLADGRLVSEADNTESKIWDIATEKCLATMKGEKLVELVDGCFAIVPPFFKNTAEALIRMPYFIGAALVGAKEIGKNPIQVWDAQGSKCISTLVGHNHFIQSLISLSSNRLASSASQDNSIKLWDVQTGKCTQTLEGHSNRVTALIELRDGQLASGSDDKSIKLWDLQTGKCVQTLEGHSEGVNFLTVLADGRLVSISGDKTIRLWDPQAGKCLSILQGHSEFVSVFTALADGRLASGSYDNTIKLWDTHTGKCLSTLRGHTKSVYTLVALPDGRLASGADDNTLRLWDTNTGSCLITIPDAHAGNSSGVNALVVLPDGRLVSGGVDNNIKIWNLGICALQLKDIRPLLAALPGTLVKQLNLQNCLLQDGDIIELMKLLPSTQLTHLDIRNTKITADGFKILYQSLKQHPTLKEIQHEAMADILAAEQTILAKQKAEEDAKKKAALDAKEKAAREAKERADKEAKEKELADLRAQVEQMKLQQNKPVNPHPVSPTPVVAQPIDLFEQFAVSRIQPTKPTIPTEAITVSLNINYKDIKLGDEIGKGGFGIVYRGTWKYNQVAVKQLLAAPTGDALKDFKEEMQTHASLRSDHIVQLYGCCLGPYCMVMQYMPRGSLSNYLKEHRTKDLDWNIGYKIITDIACGLAFLHDNEIVHRDLKSLNVLLDENYHAKLSDFGLAKIKHESKTMLRYGGSAGTTAWMAPELFARKAVYTKKADIYSLGITFWEIAARKIPFEDAADPSIIPTWVKEGEREEIPASCPPKLASLIKFCWHGKPEERPTAARIVEYLRSDEKEFSLISKTNNIAAATATAVSTPFFAASYQANSNAAQMNNLASASFAASYQMNTPVMKK